MGFSYKTQDYYQRRGGSSGKGRGTDTGRKQKSGKMSEKYVTCQACDKGSWTWVGKHDFCSKCATPFPTWQEQCSEGRKATHSDDPKLPDVGAASDSLKKLHELAAKLAASGDEDSDIAEKARNFILHLAKKKSPKPTGHESWEQQDEQRYKDMKKKRVELHKEMSKLEQIQHNNNAQRVKLEAQLLELNKVSKKVSSDIVVAKKKLISFLRDFDKTYPKGYIKGKIIISGESTPVLPSEADTDMYFDGEDKAYGDSQYWDHVQGPYEDHTFYNSVPNDGFEEEDDQIGDEFADICSKPKGKSSEADGALARAQWESDQCDKAAARAKGKLDAIKSKDKDKPTNHNTKQAQRAAAAEKKATEAAAKAAFHTKLADSLIKIAESAKGTPERKPRATDSQLSSPPDDDDL